MGQNHGKHVSRDKNRIVVRGIPASPSSTTRAVCDSESRDSEKSVPRHVVTPGTGESSVDYVEEVACMDFMDFDEDDEEDASSSDTITERLVDSEGLTEKFQQWFRESRKVLHAYNSTAVGWDWETPSGSRANRADDAGVNSHMQRSKRDHDVIMMNRPQSGGAPLVIDMPSTEHETRLRKERTDSPVVIKQKQNKWSQKRSLPEEYRRSEISIKGRDETNTDNHSQVDQTERECSRVSNEESVGVHVHFNRRVMITGTGFDSVSSTVLPELSAEHERSGTVESNTTTGTGFDDPVEQYDREPRPITDNDMWEPEPDYDYDDNSGHLGHVMNGLQQVQHREFKHEMFINYMNNHNDSHTMQVTLTEDYDPKKFLDKVPELDTMERQMPQWKRQLIARQLAEKAQLEATEYKKTEEENTRYQDMPLWKRVLLQKRELDNRN